MYLLASSARVCLLHFRRRFQIYQFALCVIKEPLEYDINLTRDSVSTLKIRSTVDQKVNADEETRDAGE
jgi:hypothetical protein